MEYRIENGKVIATLDAAEIETLLEGLMWSDGEGQVENWAAWDELDDKLKKALQELK